MSQHSEHIFQLFEDIRLRKESAMEKLYANYSGNLYGQILKIVQKEEEATELLHDVFVKIWLNIDSYNRSSGRPYTWMARIARNRAIDHLRSARSKRDNKTDGLPVYVSNSSHLAHEQYVDAIGLSKIVNLLDPKHRELIEFLYFREYTQTETAEALGIPLGTVKTRVRKAMQELRKILKKELRAPLLLLIFIDEIYFTTLNSLVRLWT